MAKQKNPKVIRDLSITKICDTCGKEYHPRKNGYQTTSRFCSAEYSKGKEIKLVNG